VLARKKNFLIFSLAKFFSLWKNSIGVIQSIL